MKRLVLALAPFALSGCIGMDEYVIHEPVAYEYVVPGGAQVVSGPAPTAVSAAPSSNCGCQAKTRPATIQPVPAITNAGGPSGPSGVVPASNFVPATPVAQTREPELIR